MPVRTDPGPGSELPLELFDERVVLRGDRSLYWPRRRWLIVADVHVGKVHSLRRDGVALPDAVFEDDLRRLGAAVRTSGAERLVILGDLVHDAHGLTPAVIDRVGAWRAMLDVELVLVPGNHDRRVDELPPAWRVLQDDDVMVDGPFRFSHDRSPGTEFNWHGHVHPSASLRGWRDHVRLPCFVVGRNTGILPAFSALTGGGSYWHVDDANVYVIAEGHVLHSPRR